MNTFFSSANGEENKCNCDLKDWDGVDHGILTGTHNLPVQELLFGDSDGPFRKEVKALERTKIFMSMTHTVLAM